MLIKRTACLTAVVATAAFCVIVVYAAAPAQVTVNALAESWSPRTPSTSQGMILWASGPNAFGFPDVRFFDGTSVSTGVSTIQLQGGLTAVNDTNAFVLGSGAAPGDVIGLWRRDTDFAWVWTRTAAGVTALTEVTYTNPLNADPNDPMNPEAAAVADGCAFLILQEGTSKLVYQVNPATGTTTLRTPAAAVPGAARVTTSQCKAAWTYDDGGGEDAYELQFFNGTTVTTVDEGHIDVSPVLNQGRLVYWKEVAGIQQVFLYDSTVASPAPVQLSNDTTGQNFMPRTDGRHVAWLHREADGVTWNVILSGGVSLTGDPSTRPAIDVNRDQDFQLNRGQLLWADTSGNPRYYAGGRLSYLPIAPAATFERFWLADGFIAALGTGGSDAGADKEVFRFTVTAPSEAAQAPAPVVVAAVAGTNQVTVRWDQIAGASSYNVYMAQQPGVTKDNYQTLTGGTRFTGVTNPFTVTGLAATGTYHFVVTTVEGTTEGPISPEARASLTGSLTWTSGTGVPAVDVRAVAADRADASVAYLAAASAGSDVYKTTNSGASWTQLAGGIEALDIRALAANGTTVIAATGGGDIWRSTDGGVSWGAAPVADGSDLGEQTKVLFMDPVTPTTIYGGNFQLSSMGPGDSYLVKSTNGGETWTHLPEPSVASAEQRAYAIARDPFDGAIYVAGNGVPLLARTGDGGATWTALSNPATGTAQGIAADSRQATSLYVGMMMPNGTTSRGIYRSITEGASWAQTNGGLPGTLPRINSLLADPSNPEYLHAATPDGYFFSLNGGNWTAANTGLTDTWINAIALTGSRRLLAGTSSGLAVLDLSIPAVAPGITTQAQSQTIVSGQTATLSVAASGTTPFTYQWFVGASGTTTSPIGGATASSYTTPALTTTTQYWVRVSNSAGAADSAAATITVTTPPAFSTQPESQAIVSGQTATMSVAASGTAPLTYQWYVGASGTTTSPIGGATASSYTTPALTTTTQYWVRVSNSAGTANSATATVTVNTPPAISTEPQSQTIAAGQTASMSVAASGTTPFSYQWYLGASGTATSPIGGATASSYTTPALTATTQYWVRVSNSAGAADSATAIITVTAPPAISTQPQSQSIAKGQTATMSVAASGTAPLAYQWYVGTSGTTTSPIGGATSSGYTTPTLTATTQYWVRVSNSEGTADSSTATITATEFTDDPLVAGSTVVKTIHITEIRLRVNALRTQVGLGSFAYTDATMTAGATAIKVAHIVDLRTALAQAYAAAMRTQPTYTDPGLSAGMAIRAVHINEIRTALLALEDLVP